MVFFWGQIEIKMPTCIQCLPRIFIQMCFEDSVLAIRYMIRPALMYPKRIHGNTKCLYQARCWERLRAVTLFLQIYQLGDLYNYSFVLIQCDNFMTKLSGRYCDSFRKQNLCLGETGVYRNYECIRHDTPQSYKAATQQRQGCEK